MEDSRALREQRHNLLERGRALVDAAEAEKRDLTEAEDREIDASIEKANTLKKQIDKIEAAHHRDFGRPGPGTSPDSLGIYSRGQGSPMPRDFGVGTAEPAGRRDRWIDAKSGQEVRTISAGESTRSLFQDQSAGIPYDELRELDWGRMLRGVVLGEWRGAELERRAMGSGLATSGGFLLPAPLASEYIDLARAGSVLGQAGTTIVPMDAGTLTLARLVGDAGVGWKVENDLAESGDPTLGKITLNARTLAGVTTVSQELLSDAPNAGELIRRSLAANAALKIDQGGLIGDGAHPNTGSLDADADIPVYLGGQLPLTFDGLAIAAETVATANEVPNAVILHPRDFGNLDRAKSGDGEYISSRPPESVAGLRRLKTSQLPTNRGVGTNESIGFLGDFSQLLLGLRAPLNIEVSREAGEAFDRYQVKVRVIARVDFGVARPGAFTKLTQLVAV